MGNNEKSENVFGSRGLDDKGVSSTATWDESIPDWLVPRRPSGPDVREKKKGEDNEIKKSEHSPGQLMLYAKNEYDGTYHWLLYNFQVGKSTLKKEHKTKLEKILPKIRGYGRMVGRPGVPGLKPIVLGGHASPSGSYGENEMLAWSRAYEVEKWFLRQVGMKRHMFEKAISTSEVYSLWKLRPTTAEQRNMWRAASIVLPTAIGKKKPSKFPLSLREKTRDKLFDEVIKQNDKEKIKRRHFCEWAISNWQYLMANKYCWGAYPNRMDGLFFKPPERPLRDVKQALHYLRTDLYARLGTFRHDTNTLDLHPAGLAPIRTPAVAAYQHYARWIHLDENTSVRGSAKVGHFAPIRSIRLSRLELIRWINAGKYGKPVEKVWDRIEKYFKKHLPMMTVFKTAPPPQSTWEKTKEYLIRGK